MGKSQTKKRTVRHNPIRLPDHHNLNNKPKTEGQVIPVLEKVIVIVSLSLRSKC